MRDNDVFEIKRDSTSPSMVRELFDGEDNPIDLKTALNVYFSMGLPNQPAKIYRAKCGITAEGHAQYDWQVGDTSISAIFEGEFIVEWAAGQEQYAPSNGFVTINIGRNIRPVVAV